MSLISCPECNHLLSDKASFCPNCGAPISEIIASQKGNIHLKRLSSVGALYKIDVYLDGNYKLTMNDGKGANLTKVDFGEHVIDLYLKKKKLFSVIINLNISHPDEYFYYRLTMGWTTPGVKRVVAKDINKAIQPKCPKCGGSMMIQTVSEDRKSGCGTILLYIILALTIFGILIVIPLMLRNKSKTSTYAVCQTCGYKQQI